MQNRQSMKDAKREILVGQDLHIHPHKNIYVYITCLSIFFNVEQSLLFLFFLLFLTAWNQVNMRQRSECCDGTECAELCSK